MTVFLVRRSSSSPPLRRLNPPRSPSGRSFLSAVLSALGDGGSLALNTRKLQGKTMRSTIALLARALFTGLFLLPCSLPAAIVAELETNGTQTNNTLATAQAITTASFTTPVPANVFPNAADNAAGTQFPTATVT